MTTSSQAREDFLTKLQEVLGDDHPAVKPTVQLMDLLESTDGRWRLEPAAKYDRLGRWFDYPAATGDLTVLRLTTDGRLFIDLDLKKRGLKPLRPAHHASRAKLIQSLSQIPGIDIPEDVESHRVFQIEKLNAKALKGIVSAYEAFRAAVTDEPAFEL